jgi:predicted DNA-binding transcriptional regulator AlpA
MAFDYVDPILTEAEYRAWIGISAPTAQRQRSEGSGPPFVQLSERRIGYRKSAVERWLAERTITRVGALISAKPLCSGAAPARKAVKGGVA